MPKNSCIMQIWAESGKSALPICNYSQILYQFLTFTQNLKRSLNVFQTKDINSYRYNLKINFSFALILLEFIIMIFFSMNYYYIHEKNQYIRRKIIITYIHNQDGEKSCAVIS